MTHRTALAGAMLAMLLSGCATSGARTAGDPLERMNRATYRFNDAIDRAVLRPVAVRYRRHVPAPVRTGIGNLREHLAFPATILNDLLQLKLKDTLVDLGRFALNSTLGIGGLLDPASRVGLRRNEEDFGQTLGRWGVPPGPYLVLPFLGPSTLRDAPASYVDGRTDLRVELDLDPALRALLFAASAVDSRAELLSLDASIAEAYDPYAFVRDAWLQRREFQVQDGQGGDEITPEELEELEREAGIGEDGDAAAAPEAGGDQPDSGDPSPPPDASISSAPLTPASEASGAGTLR